MPSIRLRFTAKQSSTGLKPWRNFWMNATDWPTTGFATWNTTRFAVTRSLRSGESMIILAGRCRERQSSAFVFWLQATRRGNLRIIDIIYRSLALLRRKSSARSPPIVSDLACPRRMARNSGHRVETLRLQKRKSVLALSRLQERIIWRVTETSRMTFEARRAISADHPSLPGHFPGAPLVPGVVILDEVLGALLEWRKDCELTGIRSVKFLAPLKPEQAFTICLSAGKGATGEVSFCCRIEDRVAVEGRLEVCGRTK